VLARGMRATLYDDAGNAVPAVPAPVMFDGARAMSGHPPPRLDQHGAMLRSAMTTQPGWPMPNPATGDNA